ncbi:MAG: hypothetical protein ACFHVJ_08090 [Aestuariibacter sp.]
MKKLQQICKCLNALAISLKYLLPLLFLSAATFIITAPTVSDGQGGFELNKLIIKTLHDKGLPLDIKVLASLLCAFGSWAIYEIFKLAAEVLARVGKTHIFVDENAFSLFKLARRYTLMLLVFVLGISTLNVLAGYPLGAVVASTIIKFPYTHVAIISCIYLVGFILKLAIENRKDLEGTI